jgi:hypothetical protein
LLELPPGALGDFFKFFFKLLSGLVDLFHGPSLPGAQVKFSGMWRLRRGSTVFSGGKLLVKDSK